VVRFVVKSHVNAFAPTWLVSSQVKLDAVVLAV